MAKNLSTILRNPSTPGALPIANGGTGSTTLTMNSVLLGNGTSAVQSIAPGTTGNVLTSNGTTWVSGAAPISLPTQTSNSGKYLTTDGTNASWGTVAAGGLTSTDDVATNASYYPLVATTAGGSTAKTSSTKYYFNPSTGTLYATGFSSLSDENQKTNIVHIDNALTTVKQIKSVKFEFNDGGKKSAGVIAQQLEQILPDLVSTAENGTKSVDYAGLIGYLIGAVKELSDKVELLEAK